MAARSVAGSWRRTALRALLLGPAVLLVAGYVLLPTCIAVVDSFSNNGRWTFDNYVTVVTTAPYPRVLLNTLIIAVLTTVISVGMAAPAAAFLSARSGRVATVMLGLLAATLSISILVKIYAWQVLLARNGPVNDLLLGAGLVDAPQPMLYTRGAVLVAMVQVMVPYACILLAAGMRRIDWELIVAARSLGARLPRVFTQVYWPQVRFTVVMTALIVFIGSSGFFVAPALLGGPGQAMLGMKMQSDLLNQYDSGLAATTGTLLTLALLAVTWGALRLTGTSFRRLAEELAQ